MKLVVSLYKKFKLHIYSIIGSFLIAAGWNWYHISHHPRSRFIVISLITWAIIFLGYFIFKRLYGFLTRRFNRHLFWQKEFLVFLDRLFFIFSLCFLVFFSRNELISFIYVSLIFVLFFWRLQFYLSIHPAAESWLAVNRGVFVLSYFIFVLTGVFQYLASRYYILDSNIRFYNIVIFRSWSITMFWLAGMAVASLIFWQFHGWRRYLSLIIWALFFLAAMFLWFVNLGVLYSAGLYFSPFMLSQIEGGGGVIFSRLGVSLILIFILVVVSFIMVIRQVWRAHCLAPKRYWYFYNFTVIAVAVLSFIGISSFKNTPEYVMARAFYRYFIGQEEKITVNPKILEKLKRFGLNYDLNNFKLAHRENVFTEEKKLLPEKFSQRRPNVIIIFLESFSARLTGPYNARYKDLTPGLDDFAGNSRTTLFRNFYNGSTPTVTGLMAELCSILPPTGHNEIEQEKKLQSHHLLCLPDILRRNDYKYAAYVTAVEKSFANKGTIFASMGVDDVIAREELSKKIEGEPLAWGYSDHQVAPVFLDLAKQKSKEPFLLMWSTVDTHPPFDLAKDAMKYKTGGSNLLNSFYTTDDAFRRFWEDFKTSELAENTILAVVADHAVFPTAYDKKGFPREAGKFNFYDELFFGMYIPENILPKEVDTYSSGLDFAPTILQILNINVPNSFEGHSIFDDRDKIPNLLGMHEFGLYINQVDAAGERTADFGIPADLNCPVNAAVSSTAPLTLCEFMEYYHWKRSIFEEGRFWEK